MPEAIYETPKVKYNFSGFNPSTVFPYGVELVTWPIWLVGDTWPYVNP